MCLCKNIDAFQACMIEPNVRWGLKTLVDSNIKLAIEPPHPPHSASEMMGTSTISFLTLYLNIKDFS